MTPVQKEDARMGYSVACQLHAYAGQLIWRQLATFLAFNIPLLIGASYPIITQSPLRYLIVIAAFLSLFGFLGSLIWLSMTSRSFQYQDHWINSARELEEKLEGVKTLQARADLRFTGFGKARIQWGIYTFYVFFIVAYAVTLVFALVL